MKWNPFRREEPKPAPPPEPTPAPPAEEPGKRKPPPQLAKWCFRPGQSGNPSGRPKGRTITSELAELLDQVDDQGETVRALLAKQLVTLSFRDLKALKLLLDRTYGRVPAADTHDNRGTLAEAIAEAEAALRETEDPTPQCDDSASDGALLQP